jgi:hypothetical protein
MCWPGLPEKLHSATPKATFNGSEKRNGAKSIALFKFFTPD